MASPSTSWNLVRVFGTWHTQGGQLKPGKYVVTIPERITNHTDDAIIPAGAYDSGDLQTATSAAPSLDIMVPSNDDPDNDQTGWKVVVTITFNDSSVREIYTINTPVADRPVVDGGTGLGVNLRTVVFPSTTPQTVALYRAGVAGGLALLNSDGDVIDAAGQPVTSGGGPSAGEPNRIMFGSGWPTTRPADGGKPLTFDNLKESYGVEGGTIGPNAAVLNEGDIWATFTEVPQ